MTNINRILQSIGASQNLLARNIGISQSSINHYAKGKRTPSYEMAWKIVSALNQLGSTCSFEEVFPNPKTTLELNNKKAA